MELPLKKITDLNGYREERLDRFKQKDIIEISMYDLEEISYNGILSGLKDCAQDKEMWEKLRQDCLDYDSET